jgi:hypothetical protein
MWARSTRGGLKPKFYKLPRPWSLWGYSLPREDSHGRTGNRTRDLMVWPPSHEAGRFVRTYKFSSFPLDWNAQLGRIDRLNTRKWRHRAQYRRRVIAVLDIIVMGQQDRRVLGLNLEPWWCRMELWQALDCVSGRWTWPNTTDTAVSFTVHIDMNPYWFVLVIHMPCLM